MDEAERRPVRRREALLELVDRRREAQLESLEPPAAVRGPRALVRGDDVELDHLRPGLAHLRDEAPRQLGGDASSTPGRPDEETAQLGDARSDHAAERDSDRLAAFSLGDPGRARLRQLVDLPELLVRVGVAPGGVLDLLPELEPELVEDVAVGIRRLADHGVRNCASR